MPSPRTLAEIAALALLGSGLAVTVTQGRRQSDDLAALRSQVDSARAREQAVSRKLDELERRPAAPRETAPPPSEDSSGTALREKTPDVPPEERSIRLVERLGAVESELESLRKENTELARQLAEGLKQAAPAPPPPADIPAAQAIVLDAQRPAGERIAALRILRSSSPDGRSSEVVAAMMTLLAESQDAAVRADVCRNLKRAVPVELKDPLLRALQLDADAKVREEAAETLGPLRSDSTVRLALEYAAKNDASLKVRSEAQDALDKGR